MRLNLLYGGAFFCALLAPLFAYRGLTMDVAVATPITPFSEGGSVANLQLLFTQQACIAAAIGFAVVGAIMFGCGAIVQSLEKTASRENSADPSEGSKG